MEDEESDLIHTDTEDRSSEDEVDYMYSDGTV